MIIHPSSRAAELRRLLRVLHAKDAPMLRATSHATRAAHRLLLLRLRREHARSLAKEARHA